jgi:adenine-specific DNA glycosylase
VQRFCDAYAQGRVAELPRAKTRTAPKRWQLVALVATAGGTPKVLLTRGDGSLFGGLWNLPMLDGHGLADARTLAEQLGAELQGSRPLGTVKHVLSHRAIELQLWSAAAPKASASEASRLVAPGDLKALGVSQLTRKALVLAGLAPSAARSA